MFKSTKILIVLAVLALPSKWVVAADYNEVNTTYNSHSLPASSATVAFDPAAFTSLDHILGTLAISGTTGLSEQGDVYKIYISDPANFSASTLSLAGGRNGFNTQLFLFNLDGTGIASNDDTAGHGTLSQLPAGNPLYTGLAAGYYYLVIDGSSSSPANSTGGAIFPDSPPTGIYGPQSSGAFTQYTGNSNEGGTYSIALTGVSIATAVPEPSSMALLFVAGGAGFTWILRKRR
jgi:hypothetical protein